MILLALTLPGCAQMEKILQPRTPTPEERAQQMYLGYLGLLLMQSSQPVTPAPQIYVINGRQIVCNQLNNVVVCN
jgi:hypothetical protein